MDPIAASHPAPRRRLRASFSALLLFVTAAFGMPAGAQDDVGDAREQRDEARRAQLEAEAALSLIDAEDIEVVEALVAAEDLVAQQQSRVDSARQSLVAAQIEKDQRDVDLAWAEEDIRRLRVAAQEFAIESYVQVPPEVVEAWLQTDDPNAAARKVALLDVVGAESGDVLDQLRAREEDRQELLSNAEVVVAQAEELEEALAAELQFLEVARARRAEIKIELDARRAAVEAELAQFEQDEIELTEFIRTEQLRLAGIDPDARPDLAASAEGFIWPHDGRVGSGFGPRLHPILGYARQHDGLDIGGGSGTPIWAAKEGVVISAGWRGGYGNAVVIQHGAIATLYAHMSQISVGVGQQVETGELVGTVGSTGLSTGPHLHFETRVDGIARDPMAFMPER